MLALLIQSPAQALGLSRCGLLLASRVKALVNHMYLHAQRTEAVVTEIG